MSKIHLGTVGFGPMPPVKIATGTSVCHKTFVLISRDPKLIDCKLCRKKMLGVK